MPTFETFERFLREWSRLTPDQQAALATAVRKFHADLVAGEGFRKGIRIKNVQGAPGVFELTWADDGRATWQYGPEQREGHVHIVWRRIGTHDIFGAP
jgi:hypothetical protein